MNTHSTKAYLESTHIRKVHTGKFTEIEQRMIQSIDVHLVRYDAQLPVETGSHRIVSMSSEQCDEFQSR
jgi:hypothetical protein